MANPQQPRPCGCNDGCRCPACQQEAEQRRLREWIQYVLNRPDVPR